MQLLLAATVANPSRRLKRGAAGAALLLAALLSLPQAALHAEESTEGTPADSPAVATEKPEVADEAAPKGAVELWDGLLKRHVSRGEVSGVKLTLLDYAALKADPDWPAALDAFATESVPADREERLAFWINAYNAMAAKVVLTKYPDIESINDLSGLISSQVWDQDAGVVAGETRTLNQIEHGILRKMGEPRIHAAIVCASVSCPDLRPEAFVAERLDEQLEDQMRSFLANDQKGARFDSKGRLHVSSIFKWFGDDFESDGGALNYVAERLPDDLAAKVTDATRLKFLDYDWTLNDAARAR